MEPPEPPPGDPLLTDSDSKFLSTFFEDMTADQYSMPSFGEGLNFSNAWLDLPPQFMGTATSFGPHSTSSLASPAGHHMPSEPADLLRSMPMSQMMPPPPSFKNQTHQHQPLQQQSQGYPFLHEHQHQHQIQHQPQHQSHFQPQSHQHHQLGPHSDDVLSAAATLLQNGSSSHRNPIPLDLGAQRRPMGPTVGHLRHQPLEDFQEDGRRSLLKTQPDPAVATDWMAAAQGRRSAPRGDLPTAFQWGSDSNFSTIQGYTPDANRQTVESMHREQLKLLEGLEVSQSAGSTRPSSPSNVPLKTNVVLFQQPPTPPKRADDPEAPPRKRRKSKNTKDSADQEEDEEEEVPAASSKGKGRRKPKNDRPPAESSPPAESEATAGAGSAAAKRRKAAAAAAKLPRENLSEEQKRENHIKSEQKRRTLIKEGFDDLCELVPGLRGGGFSKSAMLSITAEWLEEILQGNETLANQLSTLER